MEELIQNVKNLVSDLNNMKLITKGLETQNKRLRKRVAKLEELTNNNYFYIHSQITETFRVMHSLWLQEDCSES